MGPVPRGDRRVLLDSQFCHSARRWLPPTSATPGTTARRKAQPPQPAHSLPGRPPASTRGTSLSAERELEPAATAGPTRASPGGHRLVPRPPSQPVPRLHPTPQNTLLGTRLGEAVKGPPAGKSPTPLLSGCRTSASGWEEARHGPPTHGAPASFHSARVQGLSLPAGTHTLQRIERLQGDSAGREGTMEGCSETPTSFRSRCTQICVGAEIDRFGGCCPFWQHM